MQQGDQLVLVAEDSGETPRVYRRGDFTVVELHGEVDILACHHVTPLLDSLTSGPGPALVVDLRGTEFCDCSGLGLLARAHRRARERGGRVGLVCTRPLQLRIIALTGLDQALTPAATVEEAMATANAPSKEGS
ncbi:STAS domain-containing protein [Streptomyces sp. NA04227]|uniref:STAS domain-containing protein n=1 Tax=Streptomyces sp. NA04227 TaxID=2742136 RepID=UPI001591999F|nr:STAS domain-containing protein [Streptomyces sp. NA04227]QKW05225.1 STAS domain-containing protein [Streptomyces sp. NA04227]